MQIDLYILMLVIIAALAVVVVLVQVGPQRHAATFYLAGGLLLGGASTMLFLEGGDAPLTRAALYALDPLGLWAAVQSVRLALGGACAGRWLMRLILGGIALSLLLIVAGAPIAVEYLPALGASLLVYVDGLRFLWLRARSTIRTGLLVSLGVMMLTALVRLPFFPSLLDAGRTDLFAGPAWLPEFLLVTNAFAVPAVVGFIIAAVVQQQLRLYRHRSEHDGLTELLTRSAFATALREEQPGFGAIVLADIDFFKKVNDRHGHGVGDDVIRHFAALLGSAAPVAGRFGGEEFAIALPGHSIARAAELAERLRGEFATYRHEAFAPDERLSASFGVAPYYRRRPLEASLVEADRALYRAKGLGRDMVCLYGTNEFERPDTRQSA